MFTPKSYVFTGIWADRSATLSLLSAVNGKDMEGFNVNVLQDHFLDNGLSKEDYATWSAGEGVLMKFVDDLGEFVVPDIYVSSSDEVPSTVPYQQYGMSVSIGYLNATEQAQLTDLTDELQKVIDGRLGVESAIELFPYGSVKPVPDDEAATFDQIRTARREDNAIKRPTVESLLNEKATLSAKLKAMSDRLLIFLTPTP